MQTCSNRARALPAPGIVLSGRVWIVALAALLALGAALSARAQPAGDPPSRAARLSEVEGQVWLYTSESDEWVPVARNRPLTTGDRIATDNGARAEITLGTTTVRLDAATELEIARLDDTRYSVRLRGGSVAARLRNPQSLGEFEMVTDEGRFRVQAVGPLSLRPLRPDQRRHRLHRPGDLRGAQHGAAGDHRPARAVLDRRRRRAAVRDGGAGARCVRGLERRPRSRRGSHRDGVDARYVSPEMTGAEDLDRYGSGEQTPEYGAIWMPRSVSADWAPYTHRPLGVGAPLGLDLGRRRAVGLRAVPLRPLGLPPQCLVLGARHLRRPPGLRAGAGGVGRRPAHRRLDLGRRRRAGRLVPARAARGLRAGLPGQPALCAAGQRHPRHQRHQHHDDRQQPQRRGRPARFREPQVRACGDLRSCRRDDAAPAGRRRRRRATATIRRCVRWSPTTPSRRRC